METSSLITALRTTVTPPNFVESHAASGSRVEDDSAASPMSFAVSAGPLHARKVAILVAHGVHGETLHAVQAALLKAEAFPQFVGTRLGEVHVADGTHIDVEMSVEAAPGVPWDAIVVPHGDAGQAILASNCQVVDFVREQHRHRTPMLVLGGSTTLLAMADVTTELPQSQADPMIVLAPSQAGSRLNLALEEFMDVVSRRRPPLPLEAVQPQ